VDKVDFVSAPGVSAPNVYRPGGPHALVTGRCLFAFDKAKQRFRLASTHPGSSAEDVRANTGFAYDAPESVPETEAPTPEWLALLRGPVREEVAETYPSFAATAFGRAA
jgi:glutaconate CoA-transferase subunit B